MQRDREELLTISSIISDNTEEILNFIAKCKVMDIPPSEAGNYVPNPDMSQVYGEIYEIYEKHLKDDGAIDSKTVFTDALFKNVPEVKVKWQERFELIFVDEAKTPTLFNTELSKPSQRSIESACLTTREFTDFGVLTFRTY